MHNPLPSRVPHALLLNSISMPQCLAARLFGTLSFSPAMHCLPSSSVARATSSPPPPLRMERPAERARNMAMFTIPSATISSLLPPPVVVWQTSVVASKSMLMTTLTTMTTNTVSDDLANFHVNISYLKVEETSVSMYRSPWCV